MALTRKMLAAMDIPAEKIDEIISAHTETVSAIKEERDSYKADAAELADVKAKLAEAEKKISEADSAGWEQKYTALKGEYDGYKTEVETKAAKTAKESAYKKLLAEAGISEKRIASVMKVSDLDSVKMNADGTIQDSEKLIEGVKTEWADFIESKREKGADVTNPPANNGGEDGKKPSRAANMAAQYYAEHYGNKPKED